MPIVRTVTAQKFFNQITHGNLDDALTGNAPSDFLLGSVGSFFTREFNIGVTGFLKYPAGSYSAFDRSDGNMEIIGSNDYSKSGFSIGDKVTLVYVFTLLEVSSVFSLKKDVISLDENKIILSGALTGTVDDNNFSLYLFNKQEDLDVYDACIIGEGLVQNDQPFKPENITTGEDQFYYCLDMDADDNALPLGKSKSWHYSRGNRTNFRCGRQFQKSFYVDLGNGLSPYEVDGVTSGFQITIKKNNFQFYKEDLIDDLINRLPIEDLKGDKSLKSSVSLEFRKSFGNENGTAKMILDVEKGSVGDFGETLNGFPSQFEIVSYEIKDINNDPADAIDIAGSTITVRVQSNTGGITANRMYLNYQMLTSEESYLNPKRTYNENLRMSQIGQDFGDSGSGSSNEALGNYTITDQGGGIIQIECEVFPNKGLTGDDNDIKANENEQYLLYIVVGDTTKSAENCGITSLIIDAQNFIENTDIEGLAVIDYTRFLAPDLAVYTDLRVAIEDGVNFGIGFKTETNLAAIIKNISVEWVLHRVSDNDLIILKSNEVTFNSDEVNGVQVIEIDRQRGFEDFTGDDNSFNVVKMTTEALVGSLQTYEFEFSTKVPFRENVLIDVTQYQKDIFYDKTKLLNGINQYDMILAAVAKGYKVKVSLRLVIDSNGVDTIYNLLTNELTIFDYETIIT